MPAPTILHSPPIAEPKEPTDLISCVSNYHAPVWLIWKYTSVCVFWCSVCVYVCVTLVTTRADGQSLGWNKTFQHPSFIAAERSGLNATASVAAFVIVILCQDGHPGHPVEPVHYWGYGYWMPLKDSIFCVCRLLFQYLARCKRHYVIRHARGVIWGGYTFSSAPGQMSRA